MLLDADVCCSTCVCCAPSLVSLTEIDAARALGERALKAISFRLAQDKLNVWVALLNLENMYGTPSSLKAVLDRALQYNDPLTVTMELAKIYAATNKVEVSPCPANTCASLFSAPFLTSLYE